MRLSTLVLMMMCGAITLFAAGDDDAIRTAEKSWAAEVTARDFARLEKSLGDKLLYAHSTGAIESKQDYLGRLRSGAQRYDKITQESIRIVPYADAAVAHSIVRMSGVSNGKPFDDHLMVLHLWVKQAGTWQLAGHQSTKIP